MRSLGICDSVLDDQFLDDQHGRDFYFSVLMPLCDNPEWQFACDAVGGRSGAMLVRYYELSEASHRVAEWLIYADQCKGLDAFHLVDIDNQPSFASALISVICTSPICIGAVSRSCEKLAQQKPSITHKLYTPIRAKNMVDNKDAGGTQIVNHGNNVVIAGRDMESIYQNIAQQNDPEVAEAMAALGRIVHQEGNDENKEQFLALAEEVNSDQPKKGLIKSLWGSLTDDLPKLLDVATSVQGLARILGIV